MSQRIVENVFSYDTSKKAMRMAIISACFGAVSQFVIRESSIIILYATKLGAGSFLSLLSTSLQMISIAIFIIPVAYIMEFTGKRKIMIPSLVLGMIGVFIIAAAGFFPDERSRYMLIAGLLVFSITIAFYIAGWFPLLQGIVPSDERGKFFSRLRVSWQSVVTAFLLFSVLVVGKEAPVSLLQLIIFFSALLILGRVAAIKRIPEIPKQNQVPSLRESLKKIFSNKRLIHFSIYMFFLYLFSNATIPVAIVFSKLELHTPDNYTVLLSMMVTVGQIGGFFIGGAVIKKITPKRLLITANLAFIVLNFSFLLVQQYTLVSGIILVILVTLYGSIFAYSTIGLSSELISLAQPEAVNMSMAVCVAFYISGQGLSRLVSGYLLEAPFFPETISISGVTFSPYHLLFLLYALFLFASFLLVFLIPKVTRGRGAFPQY
jgi:MFS family permease